MKSLIFLTFLVLFSYCYAGGYEPQPAVHWDVALSYPVHKFDSLGDIIDGFKEFIEGFMEGAYELARWDIRMFDMCTTVFDDAKEDIEEFIKDFKRIMKHFNFLHMYTLITNIVPKLLGHFAPCQVALWWSLHILDLFRHWSWHEIETRIGYTALTNAFSVFQDVISFFICTFSGRPRCSGQIIGELLYLIILH